MWKLLLLDFELLFSTFVNQGRISWLTELQVCVCFGMFSLSIYLSSFSCILSFCALIYPYLFIYNFYSYLFCLFFSLFLYYLTKNFSDMHSGGKPWVRLEILDGADFLRFTHWQTSWESLPYSFGSVAGRFQAGYFKAHWQEAIKLKVGVKRLSNFKSSISIFELNE